MIEFIKKNMIFVSVLTLICLTMVGVSLYSVKTSFQEPSVPPEIEADDPQNTENPKPEEEDTQPQEPDHERAVIRSFYGQFSEEGNSVILYWDLASNDSVIEKVELYSQNNLIADVTNTNSYEMPITVYQFATGVNEFELRCSLKNEVTLSEKTSVNVDYIIDIQKAHEIVNDEVLGEGIMISISYTYNVSTPVGSPTITVNDGNGAAVQVQFVDTVELSKLNNYVTAKTTYFLPTSTLPEGLMTWVVTWNFEVVQISAEDRISVQIVHEQPDDEETDKDEETNPQPSDENEEPNV